MVWDTVTSSKLLKGAVFLLILGVFTLFCVYKITLPGAQDLPRQMKNGEMVLEGNFEVLTKNVYSSLEPEQPFANHHWFYGVIVYLLHALVGWSGMVVFKVLFLFATFSLLFYTVTKRADFWSAAVSALPATLLLVGRVALRPEIFSYFFVVFYLYALMDLDRHPGHKRIFWLIPFQLIWVNTHLFFPVGIMLVGGFLCDQLFALGRQALRSPIVQKLSAVLALLVVSIFLNPYGLMGVLFSLRVNTDEAFPISSAEINSIFNVLKEEAGWANISATVFLPLVFVLAISFLLVLLLRFYQKRPLFAGNIFFFMSASFGSALLSFFVLRGLPLFGLIFFIAFATNIYELGRTFFEKFGERFPQLFVRLSILGPSFLLIAAVTLIVLGQQKVMRFSEQGIGLARYAEASADFFKRQGLKGPVFNDTDIGSYLIYYLYPENKVFSDNRFGDAYSASFFRDIYFPLLRDEETWKKGVETYGFDTIFFFHYDAVEGARDFLYRRIYDPEWAWVYADNYAVILVRNTPENRDVVDRFQITSENVHQRLQYLLDSPLIGERLAAADILNLIGRIDLSTFEYLRIVSRWPDRGKVWMVLGRTELTRSDVANSNPALAAIYLERAIKEGWVTWESYSYLALAYFRLGDLDRAEEAVEEELRIDPQSIDGREWLGILAEARKAQSIE